MVFDTILGIGHEPIEMGYVDDGGKMIVCIVVILLGTALVYCPLASRDCNTCWRRKHDDIRAARAGVAIVIVGCLLVCYQFAYWG